MDFSLYIFIYLEQEKYKMRFLLYEDHIVEDLRYPIKKKKKVGIETVLLGRQPSKW